MRGRGREGFREILPMGGEAFIHLTRERGRGREGGREGGRWRVNGRVNGREREGILYLMYVVSVPGRPFYA